MPPSPEAPLADSRRSLGPATWPSGSIVVVWAGAALAMTVVMQRLGAPLVTPESPAGIVTFEFAGSLARAERLAEAWGPTGQAAARRSLLVDLLYIASYAPAIALGCRWVAARWGTDRWGWFATLGPRLSWAQALAAACDLGENALLAAFLHGAGSDGRLQLAAVLAAAKFALIAAGLAYFFLGWAALAVGGRVARSQTPRPRAKP